MKIAVTSHAVDRYKERVVGAEGFTDEAIREQLRRIIEDGLASGFMRQHPFEFDRRIIPFQSGESVLFVSIGPNTTKYDAEIAAISVLYEKEVTPGKVGLGIHLGDVFPELHGRASRGNRPAFVIYIGPVEKTIERYLARDEWELKDIIQRRRPQPDEVTIYELVEV